MGNLTNTHMLKTKNIHQEFHILFKCVEKQLFSRKIFRDFFLSFHHQEKENINYN